jgi:hypothetical protein
MRFKAMNELNDAVIAEFRAHRGAVTQALGGRFRDATVGLVHYLGRRTGAEHVTPLMCLVDTGDYVVLGSNRGSERDPLWV